MPSSPGRWLRAVIRTTRPRQWPKNLLVFAAPLAAASPAGLAALMRVIPRPLWRTLKS